MGLALTALGTGVVPVEIVGSENCRTLSSTFTSQKHNNYRDLKDRKGSLSAKKPVPVATREPRYLTISTDFVHPR